MEEALLITRLRNGSYSAFNTLYRMYAKRLYAYCLQFTKSAEESRDIVQETFVKLWENRNKLQDCPSIRPLLFAIAKNDLINAYKRRINSPAYEDYVCFQDALKDEDTHLHIEYQEFLNNVEKAIGKLSPSQQKVIRLSRFQNLSNKEIAIQTGLSEQTVKNQLSIGLKKLREFITEFISLALPLLFIN